MNVSYRLIFIGLLVLFLCGCGTTPQNHTIAQIPEDVMGPVTYFPTNDVSSMSVDIKRNQVYFMTNEGIVRYSPATQTYVMGKNLGFHLNLADINPTNIEVDDQDRIFIVTQNGVYYSRDGKNFKFLATGNYNNVVQVSGDHVVLGSVDSIYPASLSAQDNQSELQGPFPGPLLGATNENNILYFMSAEDMYKWDQEITTSSLDPSGSPNPNIQFSGAITYSKDLDSVVVIIYDNKCHCSWFYDIESGELQSMNLRVSDFITSLISTPNHLYAVGDNRIIVLTHDKPTNWVLTTMPMDTKNLIFLGGGLDNKIWTAGSAEDLSPFLTRDFLHPIVLQNHFPLSVTNGVVSADGQKLLVSDSQSGLWQSSNGGVSFSHIYNDQNLNPFTGDPDDAFALDYNGIFEINGDQIQKVSDQGANAILKDNNVLYIASYDGIDAAPLSETPLKFSNLSPQSANSLVAINGIIYFSTDDAVYRLNNSNNKTEKLQTLRSLQVNALHNFNNKLYVGTDCGVYILNQNSSLEPIPATENMGNVADFFVTQKNLYLVVDQQGLQNLIRLPLQDINNPQIKSENVLTGFYSITLFGSGDYVYAATDRGLFRLDGH